MLSRFKKFSVVAGLAVLSISTAQASVESTVAYQISQADLHTLVTNVSPFDLINWKVGDSADYDVSAGMFGKVGTMKKFVKSDEGAAIWVRQEIKLQGQNEIVEILLNKADGKVLKMIHNGKEEAIPDDKLEIISQDYTTVTVPAGTFKAIHIVAKTEKVSKIEVWANPKDTVMEGTLKQMMATGMVDITMELKTFKRN